MALITPLKGCAASTAATNTKSLNLNGPMGNVDDLIASALLQAIELRQKLQLISSLQDGGDANAATITTAIATLG